MELVNAIVAWLREHNDVLSALAALIAVVVVFFSPIGAVFRAFFRQRRGEDPPAAVPAHEKVSIGVQIIGQRFREDLCLDAAQVIENKTGIFAQKLWERED